MSMVVRSGVMILTVILISGCAPREVRLHPVHKGWWIGGDGWGLKGQLPHPAQALLQDRGDVRVVSSLGVTHNRGETEASRLVSYQHCGSVGDTDVYLLRVWDEGERLIEEKAIAFKGEPMVAYTDDACRVRIARTPYPDSR